jgi:cytochrome c553
MTNNHLPTVFGAVAVLAALAVPAAPVNAAEGAGVPNPAATREFGAKMLVCNTCHGQNGTPRNATIPVIWGQQENYLIKQLHDFQSGARDFEVMGWMAKTLSEAEVGAAAAYFAKNNWPVRPTGAASTSPPNEIAVCQICHQQNLGGGTSPVGGQPAPRLAGQSYEYLVEAMSRFADGERANSPEMTQIMTSISPTDREAIARYISGL